MLYCSVVTGIEKPNRPESGSMFAGVRGRIDARRADLLLQPKVLRAWDSGAVSNG